MHAENHIFEQDVYNRINDDLITHRFYPTYLMNDDIVYYNEKSYSDICSIFYESQFGSSFWVHYCTSSTEPIIIVKGKYGSFISIGDKIIHKTGIILGTIRFVEKIINKHSNQ